jgi:chemotaxis protein MotB
VAMLGGSGAGANNSVIQGGGADLTKDSGQNRTGDPNDPIARKAAADAMKAELAKQESRKLAALSDKISSVIANNPKLAEFKAQIRLEITPDGLQIQIVDEQNRPMFDVGSALVKVYMRDILREIGAALNGVENKISLDGHTDRSPYGSGERGYSNWELSSDRANASRRELVAAGMPDEKLARVTGMAASNLLEPQNPFAPVNRRISILVMTKEAEERLLGGKRTPVDLGATASPAQAAASAPSR